MIPLSVRPDDYLRFIEHEYLTGFVRSGGATVKFVVPFPPATPEQIQGSAREAAVRHGYVYAHVDAGRTKVHMIEQVFHEVARQVDWLRLAQTLVHRTLDNLRFSLPPGEAHPTLQTIADYNNYDLNELRRDFHRRLQEELFRDYEMTREFRIAMIRLCQAEVDPSSVARTSRDAVLEWLRGELRHISALKAALIFQKIARHNARHMLFSLARWIRKLDGAGLLIDLDITRCSEPHRTDDGRLFYTKAAVMDVYEVLRQLIDATDELTSCFVLVTCAPEFLSSDSNRGLEAYHALKFRIYDEVHDRHRPNPLSALIRVSPDAEALVLGGP